MANARINPGLNCMPDHLRSIITEHFPGVNINDIIAVNITVEYDGSKTINIDHIDGREQTLLVSADNLNYFIQDRHTAYGDWVEDNPTVISETNTLNLSSSNKTTKLEWDRRKNMAKDKQIEDAKLIFQNPIASLEL